MIRILAALMIMVCATTARAETQRSLTPSRERITHEAYKADIAILEKYQKRLADLNNQGTPISSYRFAKAQAWLDFAMDQYTVNDRGPVIEEALEEAAQIIEALEAGQKDGFAATSIIATSMVVRPDLWEKANLLKKHASFSCGEGVVAQLEVQLVWAGHEQRDMGWRHAKPYLQAAERLAREAEETINGCAASRVAVANAPLSGPPAGSAAASATQSAGGESAKSQAVMAQQTTAAAEAPAAARASAEATERELSSCRSALSRMQELKPQLENGSIIAEILFDSDSAHIKPNFRPALDRLAALMNEKSTVTVRIDGFTDSLGDDSFNMWLSLRRARAVAAYLGNAGIAAGRIVAQGAGKTRYATDNNTSQQRSKNRRAEITLLGGCGN